MIVKEQAIHAPAPKPKSFAALMEMYEQNYILLRLWLGDIAALPDQARAEVNGRVPVVLQVKERTPHTLTILMTYEFSPQGDPPHFDTRPDLLVRLYLDAKQAEVVSHKCKLTDMRIVHLTGQGDGMLSCRWRANRLLHKWVQHLRRNGYVLNETGIVA